MISGYVQVKSRGKSDGLLLLEGKLSHDDMDRVHIGNEFVGHITECDDCFIAVSSSKGGEVHFPTLEASIEYCLIPTAIDEVSLITVSIDNDEEEVVDYTKLDF